MFRSTAASGAKRTVNAAFVHDGMLRICLGDEAIDLVSVDELGIKGI